jgi:hypothetical protein
MMKETEINISKFFECNSKLFVVIGVFSALSIYFITFLSTSANRDKTTVILAPNISFNPLDYVIVACYLIVIIIILVLLKQIAYSEKDGFFPFYYWIGFDAIKRIVLIIPLVLIAVGIIFTIFIVYTPVIFPFSIVATTFLGVISFFTAIILWAKFYHAHTKNDPTGCISLLIFSIIMICILVCLNLFSSVVAIKELALLLQFYCSIVGSGVSMLFLFSLVLCSTRLYRIIKARW